MFHDKVLQQQFEIQHLLGNVEDCMEFMEVFVFRAMSSHRYNPHDDVQQLMDSGFGRCTGYIVPTTMRGQFHTINWSDIRNWIHTNHIHSRSIITPFIPCTDRQQSYSVFRQNWLPPCHATDDIVKQIRLCHLCLVSQMTLLFPAGSLERPPWASQYALPPAPKSWPALPTPPISFLKQLI